VKFLCEQCKAKYQIADDKAAGKTVRMKCRKCGYLIEVRAEVTETSVTSNVTNEPQKPAGPPRPPPKPGPPRPAPLATSLAAAKPPSKSERPHGALAGAFRTNVQREIEEISAPLDMSDLSPSDEWYVAINGVPVGPVRIAEVRRKAALGAVTEDSLAWQEGLDEWRPVRSFPELAATVREAAVSGRASLTPAPPEGRHSVHPPRPPPPRVALAAPKLAASRPPLPPARSNVVPIMSRLATAEQLEVAPEPLRPHPMAEAAPPMPTVVPDPFAASSPYRDAAASAAAAQVAPVLIGETRGKKAPPWTAIAMVAAAVAFAITAAIAIFLRPAQPPPNVVVQVPGAAPAVAAGAGTTTAAATPTDSAGPESSAGTPGARGGAIAMGGPAKGGGPAPQSTGRSLDLHSLTQNSPGIAPANDPDNGGPRAPGQCISGGQVQQVIGLHQSAIQRTCWERNPTQKLTVNVGVSLTIGADGSPQGVSASSDEPTVSRCIENDVRGWHFPAMGCSQKTAFSFKFVRQ